MDYLEVYQKYLGDKVSSVTDTKIYATCPFHDDTHASFEVILKSGRFKCFAAQCGQSGRFERFCSLLGINPSHDITKSLDSAAELIAPLAPTYESAVRKCLVRLLDSPEIMDRLSREWFLERSAITKFKLGWDGERVWIPVYWGDKLINIRKYKFDSKEAKVIGVAGRNFTWLYPQATISADRPSLLLVEGEKDCLAAQAHGFPAITFTGGAGNLPKKELLELLQGKTIKICYDCDASGAAGTKKVIAALKSIVDVISVVQLPKDVVGDKGDVTDYLHATSGDDFKKLCREAPQVWPPAQSEENLSTEVIQCGLGAARDSDNFHKRVKVIVRCIGKDLSPYSIPCKGIANCSDRSFDPCGTCLFEIQRRKDEKEGPPYEPIGIELTDLERSEVLEMIRCNGDKQKEAFSKVMGIGFGRWHWEEEEHINIEEIIITQDPANQEFDEPPITHNAYVAGDSIDENVTYEFTGRHIAHPTNQRVTHLFTDKEAKGFLASRNGSSIVDFTPVKDWWDSRVESKAETEEDGTRDEQAT
jgi:hypothetical protein